MFLPKLGLPQDCAVKSDKIFATMDEDQLRREFGKTNILVIGSPGVNLASRIFNEHCLFRFTIDPQLNEVEKELGSLDLLDNLPALRAFWKMAKDPAKIDLAEFQDWDLSPELLIRSSEEARRLFGHRSPAYYVSLFSGSGLIDPAQKVVTLQRHNHNDFAVISLGRNPYADKPNYVCIMAAGIGSLGTAHAVRALADKSFAEHPFGGIIKVDLNTIKAPPKDFEEAPAEWHTKSYRPETIIANLETALEQPASESSLSHLTIAEIENCLAFVKVIAGITPSNDQ